MSPALLEKSEQFALSVLQLPRVRGAEEKRRLFSRLVRCCTGVGAVLHEGAFGVPLREQLDFVTRAVRLCSMALYWLDLCSLSGLIAPAQASHIKEQGEELRQACGDDLRAMMGRLNEKE